jgi:ABC-type spermidine/putrescine transport system permease subunit I
MNQAASSANVDMGIAGSLTMIVLVAAFTILVISFYRRYNRALKKRDDDKN